MLTHFYDIESLENVFSLCEFSPENAHLDVYVNCDLPGFSASDPNFAAKLHRAVLDANYNFSGGISVHDLTTEAANVRLAETYGLSDADLVNDPNSESRFPARFRPVCDTDTGLYDENKHPYLLGYNSFNYDTTMLAWYLSLAWEPQDPHAAKQPAGSRSCFTVVSPAEMRRFNNSLFEPQFKDNMSTRLRFMEVNGQFVAENRSALPNKIRSCMLMSGRHVDVARLNEKQSKVGLKRLLGMLGGQILESSKLGTGQTRIKDEKELCDLLAYNASDVIQLHKLFQHKVYTNAFALKKGLLKTYPELIYQRVPGQYRPDVRPEAVRFDRLCIDSSSAQFATKSLCPYDHLTDIPAVSFLYPSERKAKELGIPRVNVLDEARAFFYRLYPQPEVRREFDRVYNYYKTIEGKNFNNGKNYQMDYERKRRAGEIQSIPAAYELAKMPKADTCLPYFDRNGKPTSCFVVFSTGGIHGAEYNMALFEDDRRIWEQKMRDLAYVQSVFPEPEALKKAKHVTMPDGTVRPAGDFLMSRSTQKKAYWKDIAAKEPKLFVEDTKGGTKLNTDYVFTSADMTNHEDFTSYYPNMLRMMEAFFNEGLGYDRYGEVFDQKSLYGKKMKDKSLPEAERDSYKTLREGVKLILNSASGAGDMLYDSNIRMNNNIISMRLIGQIFSWRIGQAQAYEGARVPSTNTDGLYTVMEATLNNEILEREAANIHVDIEPEPTYLISKDSNNRLEYDIRKDVINSAAGGSLACFGGPDPTKSLAHPAVIDWSLCEYLIVSAMGYKGMTLSEPFRDVIGRHILKHTHSIWDKVKLLNMFQNVIASSVGSINYIYGVDPNNPSRTQILQHYNRVFIMKDGTPGTLHLYAANARQITAAVSAKRARNEEPARQSEPVAANILRLYGVTEIPYNREAVTKKVSNIDSDWYMLVENRALEALSNSELDFIIQNLDLDKYLQLLRNGFENNWRNYLSRADRKATAPEEKEEAV